MTNEQLEQFIDAQHKDGFKQWASYEDFKSVDDALMEAVMEECHHYCYDAVNLVFELNSSTSGMYSSWSVDVSPSCTVYLDKPKPQGQGGSLNGALANLVLMGRFKREEYKPKLKKNFGVDCPHTTAGNPV